MQLRIIVSKVIIVFSAITFGVGFYHGAEIASQIHKEIIGFLVTISAIIFGVMGAWLSITKIELQHGIEHSKSNEIADEYMARARGMIKPITIASLVLIFSTSFIFIQPILETVELTLAAKWWLKSISFAMISAMGYSVIYCLGCIIFQGAEFLLELSENNQDIRANRKK